MEGMQTVFQAAGGNDGLRRLRRLASRVMANDVGRPCVQPRFHPSMSSDSPLTGRGTRWPRTYSDPYGDETTVVKMHSGNGERDEMNRRAIVCFDLALADIGLSNDDVCDKFYNDYFRWATTTTMFRYHQSADDVLTASASRTGHGTDSRSNTLPPQLRTFILTIVAERPASRRHKSSLTCVYQTTPRGSSALRKLATKGFEEIVPARPFSADPFSGDVLEADFGTGTTFVFAP